MEYILNIDDNGFYYDVELEETVENPITGGVTSMLQYRNIQLHFAREETIVIITNDDEDIYVEIPLLELLEVFNNENTIPNEIPRNLPPEFGENISQAGGYVYIKNIGKRKIRYYKNGNPYVIVRGKKKRL